jgi:signal transduction histidine kinase
MIESTHPIARTRLALLILSPVLLMTVVAVAVSLALLADLGPVSAATTDAGLARVGDDLALVLVADGATEVAAARDAIATWGLLAPAVVFIVGSLIAWAISGRVHGTVVASGRAIEIADRERDGHLQEIVHELRTPLAVMGTNLELATSGGDPDKYLTAARRAVSRMSRTVDDLAGHGRLSVEAGDEPTDLATLAETVAHEHVGPGRDRGIFVRLAAGDPVVVAGVDPAAIRTVVGNFMSNAMRFAPKGSVVGLDWGREGDWAWLSVTDQGPGMSPQDVGRVFERGWQGSHDRDRNTGSGLGLTIARQFAEAQGGHVSVDSEEGGGATFALWLPLTDTAVSDLIVAPDGVEPLLRPWMAGASSGV